MARTRTPEISWPQVHAFRVRRHRLDRPAAREALPTVASDMCGAQAQILSSGRLAFRARTRNLRSSDVERALFKDRSLVAAWCMRGTRHFLASKEFAVYSGGCHPHIGRRWTSWFVRNRWPMDTVEQIVASIGRAMDRPRTRDEILRLVKEDLGLGTVRKRMSRGWGNVSHTDGLVVGRRVVSMRGMIGYACNRGLACCGPEEGNEATFVRPDAWIPEWQQLKLPEAEREFLRRYLRAFGPSTPEDFQIWSSFPLRGARALFAGFGDELVEVLVEGRRAWVLRDDLRALRAAKLREPVVRLLPYFDSYLLGHRKKDHLIGARYYGRIYRPAGWIAPAVLVDGRIAATWNHEKVREGVEVKVEPFGPLSRSVKEGIAAESEDLGRFLEAPAHVSYG